jgi:hypothetical protein
LHDTEKIKKAYEYKRINYIMHKKSRNFMCREQCSAYNFILIIQRLDTMVAPICGVEIKLMENVSC